MAPKKPAPFAAAPAPAKPTKVAKGKKPAKKGAKRGK